MSTTLDAVTVRFEVSRTEQNQTGRSRPAATVWAMCNALCDGLVAYRQYEHLLSWGAQRDDALRHALLRQS